jgi:hypothetical protein
MHGTPEFESLRPSRPTQTDAPHSGRTPVGWLYHALVTSMNGT